MQIIRACSDYGEKRGGGLDSRWSRGYHWVLVTDHMCLVRATLNCMGPWAALCSLTQPSAKSGCLVDPHSLSKCTVPIGTKGDLSLTPLCLMLPSPPTLGSLPMCLTSLVPVIYNSVFLICFMIFSPHLHCWHRSFLFPVLLWIYIFIGS